MSYKLLADNLKPPLINAGFTHNAISLNLNDIKEIYEFIKNKCEYFNITLYSKIRPIFCLQSHTLFNSYLLNVKKRKVNIIPAYFYDLKDLLKEEYFALGKLDVDLFVINTSGDILYKKKDFYIEQKILEFKFNKPTPYEIVLYKNKKTSIYESEGENDSNETIKLKILFYLLKFILLIWLFIIICIIANLWNVYKKNEYINLSNANNNYF